ncbi:YdcF family protein [Demequina capsici]|uniref:YdcF family protein n=1 Tax=Demequina capsici TaxID=3075620 RepID=A0AA96FGG2_9MICO|nr:MULTISPECIES: YdcF family protein [unclassified Demequina]WNM25154.1 YdcF family protein [Demequina sp. OYTSA14]WNM28061.1 YdcF family protein [Demequina sp. PMTSA13]
MRRTTTALVGAIAASAAPHLYMRARTWGAIHGAGCPGIDVADAALVLGARVWDDGRPSRFLRERVEVAAALFHSGLVPTLLLSGAGVNREGLDETAAMRDTALSLGVPEDALVLDPGGYDTRLSARGAVEHGFSSVIVCSQEFHLPRAVWLCERAGLDAQGVHPAVALRAHTAIGYGRELAASWKAALVETGAIDAA